MIQVTLSFPTQVALLEFFAHKLRAEAADRRDVTADEKAAVLTEAPPKPAGKPKAEKPAASAPAAAPSEPTAAAPAPAPAEKPAKSSVDYPTLQKAVFALAGEVQKQGLDPKAIVLGIAAKHGAPTFKELPAETWAAALADVKAKLAEITAPAAEEAMA